MVATPRHLESDSPESFHVRSRNRVFPASVDADTVEHSRITEIAHEHKDSDLVVRLEERLWSQLPIAHEFDLTDSEAISAAHVESLELLETREAEFREFVKAVCRCNVEFRQESGTTAWEARHAALDKALRRILKRGAKAVQTMAPSASVAARRTLHRDHQSELRSATHEFVVQVEESLRALVDHRVAGLVEWTDQHSCRLHFFREVVVQESGPRQSTTQRVSNSTHVITTTTVTQSGEHTFRQARHEHWINNAFETTVNNTRVVLPPNVISLLESVPKWLIPSIRVIEGELTRQRIIERDRRTESWEDVTVRTSSERVRGGILVDPAVVIGEFVLTGWGPQEISAEQMRQQDIASSNTRRSEAKEFDAWFVVSMVAHIVSFFVALGAYATLSSMVASGAIIFGLAGVFATWNAARRLQRLRTLSQWLIAPILLTLLSTMTPVGFHILLNGCWYSNGSRALVGFVLTSIASMISSAAWPSSEVEPLGEGRLS